MSQTLEPPPGIRPSLVHHNGERQSSMKIASIKAYRVLQPFVDGPYRMSKGRVADAFDSLIVEVVADNGLTGWGEMAPLGNFYAASFAAGARAGVTEMAPHLIGQDQQAPAQVDRLMRHLEGLDAKVHELDEVLSGEEFAPTHAERRLREGDRAGAGSAADALRRLTALRARAAQERDDLLALSARLLMQVTLLRFAEGAADDDLGELVHELLARVEGAGAAMEGEPASQRPTDGARVGVSSPA